MIQGSEVVDPALGAARAEEIGARPEVKAWIRKMRRLLKQQPHDTWLYMQEDDLNIMALGSGGEVFRQHGSGTCQSAIIDKIHIPGADAGAW